MSDANEGFIAWTAPERRTGDQELSSIPFDIYIEIISYFDISKHEEYVDHKRTLGNLGLVCRFFHSLTLPMLFRTIRVRVNFDTSQRQWLASQTPFLQSVVEGKDPIARLLGTYVQEYDIQNLIDSYHPSPITQHFDDLYAAAMQNMRNISTFRLYATDLSSLLLKNISQLPNLNSLTFDDCSMGKLSSSDILTLTSSIKLRCLQFYSLLYTTGTDWIENLGDLAVADFAPLAVNSHLMELGTSSWKFLQCLMASEVVPPLRTLRVYSVRDPIALYNSYLSRIPTLVELRLSVWPWLSSHEIYHPVSSDKRISLSVLPNLRRLSCNWDLAYMFTGPHSLDSATFSVSLTKPEVVRGLSFLMEEKNETVRAIDLSSVLVERHRIDGWSEDAKKWLPNLQKLSVSMTKKFTRKDFDDFFKEFIASWGAQITLTDLRFYAVAWECAKYEKVDSDSWFTDMIAAMKVEEFYPNLACFEIACGGFGGRWDRDKEGIWR